MMKKLILLKFLILSNFITYAQSEILDTQIYTLPKVQLTNTAVAIDTVGMFTLVTADKKKGRFIAYSGANLTRGNKRNIDLKKGYWPIGTLSNSDHSYIYLVKKGNYCSVESGKDFKITLNVNFFPDKFRPDGLVQFQDKGIFYNNKSILVHDPANRTNQLIPVIPNYFNNSAAISDVQTFENSDEIIIYLSTFGVISHLMRFQIGAGNPTVLKIPSSRKSNTLEGKSLIAGNKTYFSGTVVNNKKEITGLQFLIFDKSDLFGSSSLPLDSLAYNKKFRPNSGQKMTDYIFEPGKFTRYDPPLQSVTYTPILLNDGTIVLIQDLYVKMIYEMKTTPQKHPVTNQYSNSSKIFMGYENYVSLVLRYNETGELLWNDFVNHDSKKTSSNFPAEFSVINRVAPQEIEVIKPFHTGFQIMRIYPFDEVIYTTSENILPVDFTRSRFFKSSIRLHTKQLLPITKNKYLFHGYDVTVPIDEVKPIFQQASFQLLEINLNP